MAQCKLSKRQEDLLRAIAEGLQAREHPDRQWWVRMMHDHGLPVWQNVEDESLRERLQRDTTLGDLVTFQNCGFIENPAPGRYFLVVQKLLDAVENGFYANKT
jgi:hypothetical protein